MENSKIEKEFCVCYTSRHSFHRASTFFLEKRMFCSKERKKKEKKKKKKKKKADQKQKRSKTKTKKQKFSKHDFATFSLQKSKRKRKRKRKKPSPDTGPYFQKKIFLILHHAIERANTAANFGYICATLYTSLRRKTNNSQCLAVVIVVGAFKFGCAKPLALNETPRPQ